MSFTRAIVFSLVLYKHSLSQIYPLLSSISNFSLAYPSFSLILSVYDGSPLSFRDIPLESQIKQYVPLAQLYYTRGPNIGFGASNNVNFRFVGSYDSGFIFVLANPDTYFSPGSLLPLFLKFCDDTFSCIAPLILNPPDSIQYSAKRNPTFLSLFLGFFSAMSIIPALRSYSFRHKNCFQDYRSEIISSTYLSGCFLAIPSHFFDAVGGFDEDYFLHLEDADIVRRLSAHGQAIHYPESFVYHRWARGSHKSFVQIAFLLRSYLVYVSKWGFRFS